MPNFVKIFFNFFSFYFNFSYKIILYYFFTNFFVLIIINLFLFFFGKNRDVKAGNLLVHATGTVKLGDFGVSASMIEDGMKKRRQTFAGTPCWMAPEVVEQVNEYDQKADIWSLGITALELAKGQAPLAHHPPMKVLIMILQNPPPSAPSEGFSRSFQSFVETCLQKDPARRPTASKLKEHRFFSQVCKPELVQQSLVKNLPLLWERVRTPVDESSGSNTKDYSVSPNSSFTANWNFSSDVDKNESDSDGNVSDLKSNSDQFSSTPSGNTTPVPLSSASDSAVASEKTVEIKGRFIKTVISKPLTANESSADSEDDKAFTKSAFPTDPLQILVCFFFSYKDGFFSNVKISRPNLRNKLIQ